MKLRGITACQLAADIDVSPSRIVEPVNGRCPITADTALRLVIHFGMDARFRMTLLRMLCTNAVSAGDSCG